MQRARTTTVSGTLDPHLATAFSELQVRLARVLDSGRTTLPAGHPAPDPQVSGAALAAAERQTAAGELEQAVATLDAGELAEPNDPRLPFRRGELLHQLGRSPEAIDAWRRALVLDPEVALTYFQIGRTYKELGDRVNAVFYLEQAERRFEPGKRGQVRSERMIQLLTLPMFAEAGFSDGQNRAQTRRWAARARSSRSARRESTGGAASSPSGSSGAARSS